MLHCYGYSPKPSVPKLDYRWKSPSLLETALSHSGWCHDNGGCESYERLEWLGDTVLDLIVAESLFMEHPHKQEGFLSERKAKRVNAEALAKAARRLDLDREIRLGRGTHLTERILANVMEAVIGAAYLDGGLRAARAVVGQAGIV